MNIFHAFASELQSVLAALPETADLSAETRARVTVEPPRDASHGDLSTNAAMVLSKEAKTNPRALAEALQRVASTSDEERTAMGAAANRRILDRFSVPFS